MSGAPTPVFEAPWHAQSFALAVYLNERGIFDWPEWTQVFGATLAEHGLAKDLDGGDDYFLTWVEALERICTDKGVAELEALSVLKGSWERAYLVTPHGAPVDISAGEAG